MDALEPASDRPLHHPLVSLALAAGLAVAFLVTYGVVLEVIRQVTDGVSFERPGMRGALALAAAQSVVIVVGLGMMRSCASSLRSVGLLEPPRRVAAGAWALAPAGLLVTGLPILDVVIRGQDVLAPNMTLAKAAAFVLLAMLIGVNEELWFRGTMVDVLGGVRRPWLTVIGSSVIFGLPHLSGTKASLLNALAVTLAVGVPYAVVRLRHAALLPLIGWHASIDIWAFLHTSSVVVQGEPSTRAFVAGLILPTCIALGYAGWFAARRRRELVGLTDA